jgi:hypothetical protein
MVTTHTGTLIFTLTTKNTGTVHSPRLNRILKSHSTRGACMRSWEMYNKCLHEKIIIIIIILWSTCNNTSWKTSPEYGDRPPSDSAIPSFTAELNSEAQNIIRLYICITWHKFSSCQCTAHCTSHPLVDWCANLDPLSQPLLPFPSWEQHANGESYSQNQDTSTSCTHIKRRSCTGTRLVSLPD